jgi:biopolymer transport protein ExbB/TolQ
MDTPNLLSLMHQGGAVMWPLFALLVICLVVACERTVTLILLARRKQLPSREKLANPLSILDTIAMVSPVLGFLGTVTGMINAFKSVSEATSVQLQVVASGLYEALFTTAFGLIISIVATILSFILEMAIEALCDDENTR